MKKITFILSSIVLLMSTACSSSSDEPGFVEVPRPELSGVESRAIEGLSDFSVDFFQAVNAENEGENVVVSPLSASMFLSMLANVTDEATTSQICATLGSADVEALNTLSVKYMNWLPNADKGVKMSFANSVWYKQDYTLNPSFSAVAQKYYNSDLFARDFDDSRVVEDINSWTSRKTEGLIDRFIDDVNPTMNAVQINALYFKGAWMDPFEVAKTRKGDFNGVSGKSTVDMMNIDHQFIYGENDKFAVVTLPFGKGTFNAMMILPKEDTDIDGFIASGALKDLEGISSGVADVRLSMPKFKLEPEKMSLNPSLKTFGIDLNGSEKVQMFTEIVDAYTNVFQKSTIEFNEKGAEAAAVTGGILDGAVMSPKTVTMELNRPFVFMICERNTGLCLFAGKVAKL